MLPAEKAGVGSAVNDVTRELGGAFGVAVVGAAFSSVYGPALAGRLAGLPLPPEALAAAQESAAAALAVARQAPEAVQAVIIDAARTSFVEGMARGSAVCAGVALIGAVFAFLVLPRHLPTIDADTLDPRANDRSPTVSSPRSPAEPTPPAPVRFRRKRLSVLSWRCRRRSHCSPASAPSTPRTGSKSRGSALHHIVFTARSPPPEISRSQWRLELLPVRASNQGSSPGPLPPTGEPGRSEASAVATTWPISR